MPPAAFKASTVFPAMDSSLSPAALLTGAAMAAPHANHDAFMRRAIELSAQGGIKEMTGGCFGAIVVETATGEIVGEGYNKVIKESDPTW